MLALTELAYSIVVVIDRVNSFSACCTVSDPSLIKIVEPLNRIFSPYSRIFLGLDKKFLDFSCVSVRNLSVPEPKESSTCSMTMDGASESFSCLKKIHLSEILCVIPRSEI